MIAFTKFMYLAEVREERWNTPSRRSPLRLSCLLPRIHTKIHLQVVITQEPTLKFCIAELQTAAHLLLVVSSLLARSVL
jgi:hypothetical protein